MFLILVAIITAVVMSWVLFKYGDVGYRDRHIVAGVIGLLLGTVSAISAITYAFIGWYWFAAEHKAKIINREYGTNYTQVEVFYASDVIETVRQLERNRYEINGDLIREKEAKP